MLVGPWVSAAVLAPWPDRGRGAGDQWVGKAEIRGVVAVVLGGFPGPGLESVAVGQLSGESLLFTDNARAPELNEFITEMCRSVGFTPRIHPGRVESVRAAAMVVSEGRYVACVPRSCEAPPGGTIWVPLIKPTLGYPWSLLWRADNTSIEVRAMLDCARVLARSLNWICCDSCLQTRGGEAIISCGHVS